MDKPLFKPVDDAVDKAWLMNQIQYAIDTYTGLIQYDIKNNNQLGLAYDSGVIRGLETLKNDIISMPNNCDNVENNNDDGKGE